MDLLAQYSDDEEVAGTSPKKSPKKSPIKKASTNVAAPSPFSGCVALLPAVDAAPDVSLVGMIKQQQLAINPKDKKLLTNPSFAVMDKPLAGPCEVGQRTLEDKFTNHKCGHVEKAHMNKFIFDKEYLSFHNFGTSANPARNAAAIGKDVIVSTEAAPQHGRTIWDKPVKRRRMNKKDTKDGDLYEGRDGEHGDVDKWGGFADESDVRKTIEDEVRQQEEEVQRQKEEERAVEGEEKETKERVTSIFHGAKETDYAGRGWLEQKGKAPKNPVGEEQQCYLPKKWVHTWSGHTMGVQQIRWFPKTAHLILSAGMDSTVKIWEYGNQRKCLRTYMGHDQAVRDVNFTDDGKKFYSVSYDKNVQYWDTETGQIISTFTNKKTPFCVAVHPDPSQQNIIVTGCSNKKAVQWDANSATIVQEYDEHLGAVNTVTFCEDGKRLLTSSDDKKIFLWEYGIPVVVKYIAEPTMHSVPAVTLSTNKKYLLCQSMDNKMITYEAFGRFKYVGRKTFKGHLNSGYAITPGWSNDDRWVMSGDADGKLWFWDFAKMKNYRVLKAHDGVLSSCMWHPHHTSRAVTCGWDGAIKLWD